MFKLPSPDVDGPGSVLSPTDVPGVSELSAPVFSNVRFIYVECYLNVTLDHQLNQGT